MSWKRTLFHLCLLMILNRQISRSEEIQTKSEYFEMKIRPLLAEKCLPCHSASELGGLRLDSRERLLKGGKSGPAVIPGNPEKSLLVQVISGRHERLKMPPNERLKEDEISALAGWVQSGAYWPEPPQEQAAALLTIKGMYVITAAQRAFWSFQPIRRAPIPKIANTSRIRSPIDAFILSKLEAQHLAPVREADKRTLIRRASFDLIGLPPTQQEVEAFLRDS